MRHWGYALVLYLALACWLTWPMTTQLTSHVPLGTLPDPTVPYFNLWTLEWNADRLGHGYQGYWDAPLFYPAKDTFALSEPQGLTGLIFAPLAWCFGSIAAYNLTLLSLLCLNAAAGRHWLRAMRASQQAATLGGAFFLALPFVRQELGVLQLCAAWPVILGLREIVRLCVAADAWALLRLGVWTAASAWSCIYYVLFLVFFVLLAVIVACRPALLVPRMLAAGLGATLVLGLAIWPLMAAERRAVSGYTRSPETVRSGSASVTAYVQLPRHTLLGHAWPKLARAEKRRSLNPGLLIAALAVLGLTQLRRLQLQRVRRYCLLGLGLALWLSLGTRLHLGSFEPYGFVERHLPGFGQLRSPYRAALFVQLLATALAGLALDRLQPIAAARRWALARLLPGLVAGLALIEVAPWQFKSERVPRAALVEPFIPWLRAQPAGAVAMVPPNAGGRAAEFEGTVVGMLQALRHGHPIVNGYSGFVPELTHQLVLALRKFPKSDAVPELQKVGVRWVVLDKHWAGAKTAAAAAVKAGLSVAFDSERRTVYRLPDSMHDDVRDQGEQRQ